MNYLIITLALTLSTLIANAQQIETDGDHETVMMIGEVLTKCKTEFAEATKDSEKIFGVQEKWTKDQYENGNITMVVGHPAVGFCDAAHSTFKIILSYKRSTMPGREGMGSLESDCKLVRLN